MDLLGHERQRAELEADIQTGNVAHAYLFAGPPHVGKFTIAKWFASKLLTNGQSEEDATATQHAIDRMIHPDMLVLDQLWMEEKMEDLDLIAKSSNITQEHRIKAGIKTDRISIDDVRAMQDRISATATDHYRCILIRSIERMDDAPTNAFLKILEEPPAGRVFILTTQAMGSLLPTVVSRTRIVHFSPLPIAQMQQLVKDADPDDAQFILHIAQGAPGLAHRLLADPDLIRTERLLHTQAGAFWRSRTMGERLKLLSPLLERSTESDRFLLHLSLTLREHQPLSLEHERSLRELLQNLETNVHRGLLTSQFAMAVDAAST